LFGRRRPSSLRQINAARSPLARIVRMHAPRTIEFPVSEPPAALLARFDRLLPRNLALPPDMALAHPLSVADLREALACRRRPAGSLRNLSSHLLVGLPSGTGPGGDRTLAAIFRELREL